MRASSKVTTIHTMCSSSSVATGLVTVANLKKNCNKDVWIESEIIYYEEEIMNVSWEEEEEEETVAYILPEKEMEDVMEQEICYQEFVISSFIGFSLSKPEIAFLIS